MKKSKVIIPALGILVLSTAASVTGTVAWFTANTKYNTTVGDFAVVKTNDDLVCVQAPGVGTNVSAEDTPNNTITVKSNYELTDASFDHTANDIIAPDSSGQTVGSVTALGSANETNMKRATYMVSTTEHTVYTAFTWTMTFKVKFGGVNRNYGLYMDHTADHSAVTKKSGAAIASTDTAKGFRLALVGQTATYSNTRVWADNQTSANCQFVDGLTAGTALAGTAYASPMLIDSAYNTALPTAGSPESTSVASARPDYLGKFVFQANTEVSLVYTAVAWFEGTDPTIVNAATVFDTVTAAMHFEAIPLSD